MRRYLIAIVFVLLLALSLPELSRIYWSEDAPSHTVTMVELSTQQTVHNQLFNFPIVLNRMYTKPFVYQMFSLDGKKIISKEKFKIMIDAGHGGRDPGSPGVSEKEEKQYTLSLANKVYELLLLESGILPILTRKDDSYMTTDDRVAMANREQVDLFISLHANSFTNKKTRGTETYYYNSNSILLANILHEYTLKATGFIDRSVRRMDYKVIKETTMPAALLEIGYMSNATEELIMMSEQMQEKVAVSIVNGIRQYMKSTS
jgi:N-acetylmuramoyl-L-alanine amidase